MMRNQKLEKIIQENQFVNLKKLNSNKVKDKVAELYQIYLKHHNYILKLKSKLIL